MTTKCEENDRCSFDKHCWNVNTCVAVAPDIDVIIAQFRESLVKMAEAIKQLADGLILLSDELKKHEAFKR